MLGEVVQDPAMHVGEGCHPNAQHTSANLNYITYADVLRHRQHIHCHALAGSVAQQGEVS